MDGVLGVSVQRFLDQDQDLVFGITTVVGDFTVISFEAEEEVNGLYEVRIELASPDPRIDLHDLMDTQACLSAHSKYSEPRYWNGIVVGAERGDSGAHRTLYSLTLRPSLYRLAHISDSKIYQHLPVQEIVKQVFAEFGVQNVSWRLEGTHEPREFCCQFNETALRFVTRLLGEEGAFWYFNHTPEAHELIITDAPLATPMLPNAESITYNAQSGGQSRGFWICSFVQREQLRSTAYELNDYSFHNPNASYKEPTRLQENNGLSGDYPLYEYPGRYKDPARVGRHFVKHRMESTRVDATTGKGKTNNIHLMPGYHFRITDHDDEKVNGSHFLLSVKHRGQQPTALQEDAPDQGATTYEAAFVTMPGHMPYRPPIVPKPIVDGPQIAIVTGPEGEEIYTDEHGRVKIWFPWDRHGEKNEHSSCWVRVAQNWAGGGWGHMAIPRIGQEVICEFLDGDIDQPIVSGRTYHSVNRPPYKLPEHKTRMTIKSKTHKGEGFNELRFEDDAGQEEIFIHAQKDMNQKIENNASKRVNNNEVNSVGGNKMDAVRWNYQNLVGLNYFINVGGGQSGDMFSGIPTEGIGPFAYALDGGTLSDIGIGNIIESCSGSKFSTVSQSSHQTVLGSNLSSINHDSTTRIGKNQRLTIGGDAVQTVTGSSMENVSGSKVVLVDGDIVLSNKNAMLALKESGEIILSGTSVKIISTSEIMISGKKISLN